VKRVRHYQGCINSKFVIRIRECASTPPSSLMDPLMSNINPAAFPLTFYCLATPSVTLVPYSSATSIISIISIITPTATICQLPVSLPSALSLHSFCQLLEVFLLMPPLHSLLNNLSPLLFSPLFPAPHTKT